MFIICRIYFEEVFKKGFAEQAGMIKLIKSNELTEKSVPPIFLLYDKRMTRDMGCRTFVVQH